MCIQSRGGEYHSIGHWLRSCQDVKWHVHGKAVKTSEQRIEHKRLLRKQNYQQRQVEYDELNIIINADLNAAPPWGISK